VLNVKKSIGSRTIVFPTPTWIVGTYDCEGKPNVMTAAWGGICCSKPPCVYVSLRKATYTHGNIMRRKAFTINVPSEKHVKEADYFGISSGKNVDKFSVSGFTPVQSSLVDAPYVGEFPLVLECKVLHIIEIGLHTQFIGEIIDVKADLSVLDINESPDITKVKPVLFDTGGGRYFGIGSYLGKAFSIGKEVQSNQV
jgi:flavin reductase (DIM6/NTAB) family NADH-FMN oxidoreductase RutF